MNIIRTIIDLIIPVTESEFKTVTIESGVPAGLSVLSSEPVVDAPGLLIITAPEPEEMKDLETNPSSDPEREAPGVILVARNKTDSETNSSSEETVAISSSDPKREVPGVILVADLESSQKIQQIHQHYQIQI